MVTDDRVTRGETALAVDGQGIYFYFDRKKKSPVLNGVDIAVTRGTIYSLLGPSGCGKTTLLKCIIGQYKLQEGSLKIYGRAPGSKGSFIPGRGVGYMPQDLALFPDMTVEEILMYFGALYQMNKQAISKRILYLLELLALPSKRKQVKHLSGGQQRRVSFAVAVIHMPPLLILDEPTVGTDPLLRRTIWNHLRDLTKTEQSSIVITTHYIEEARQANVVGFMRNGQLLAEGNPEDLIKQYRVVKLEDVFLRLCQNKRKKSQNPETSSGALTSVESFFSPSCSTRNNTAVRLTEEASIQHANTMKTNCPFEANGNKRNETSNERNNGQDDTTAFLSPPFLPQEMFVPTLPLMVFCLCIGVFPFDLPVAIVNMEETTGYNRVFINSIDNRTFRQKQFGNLSLALESVRSGYSWASVYIGPEFSNCILDRILDGLEATNETVLCSEIKVHMDMSNPVIFRTVYHSLFRSFQTFSSDFLKKSGKNPLLASNPLKIEDPVYGSSSTTFTEFMVPGIFLNTIYLMSVVLTALSIILEKKQGLLERTFAAGATVIEAWLSHFLACILSMVAQITMMLLCTFLIFNIPCNGSFFWCVVCVMLAGVAGMSFGLFVSAICEDTVLATFIVGGTFSFSVCISGMLWPVEGMPLYLRNISYCLPLTLISHSLRCILLRGWDITDHHIWDGCLVCIAWTVLFMAVSMISFKIRR